MNGVDVPGGNRGRVVAFGPFVRYPSGKDWGITFKWQWETLAQNRPEGNRLLLRFGWQFF